MSFCVTQAGGSVKVSVVFVEDTRRWNSKKYDSVIYAFVEKSRGNLNSFTFAIWIVVFYNHKKKDSKWGQTEYGQQCWIMTNNVNCTAFKWLYFVVFYLINGWLTSRYFPTERMRTESGQQPLLGVCYGTCRRETVMTLEVSSELLL